MGRIIGIDLGTTNSCVACMEGGEAVIIPSENGERTTPSVVAFTKEGELLVGHAALRQAVTNASRTVQSIKRDMGTDRRVQIDNKKYTPQEISAFILQKLKADAERYLGEPVTDAVITVPAYFSDAQRQATKDAGRIAGLSVLRIINEPTAAALAYGIDRSTPQKVMVYDLGGGTFDVSVLEINQEVIEVLATAGNNRLGGDDFDACLAAHIVDAFKKANKIDLSRDPMAMQRVRDAAEKAKRELSSQQRATVTLPYLSGDAHLELAITRETFDSLTRHLVEATIEPMRQAMRDANLTPAELRTVLLVGGSTRIPAVQEAVREYTKFEASRNINPDECVAVGAALQGGVMIGQVTGLLLLDVTPLSLGIETLGNVFSRVIDRNTTIPVKRSQVFTTAADFQSSVDIHVLQGERPIASANKTLGKFRLKGIKRAFRGVPQIEVTFAIDTNGIVSVSAKDTATGKHQEITITHSSNMSNREIEQAIRDAEMFAQEDARSRESAEIRNEAEQRYYQAKNTLKSLKGAQRESVQAAMNAVQKAQKAKDDEALKTATDALSEALAGAGASFEPGAADDGAMDADFEKDDADEKDD